MALTYGVSGATVSRDSNPVPGPVAYEVSGQYVTQFASVSQPGTAGNTSQFLANDANTVILTNDAGTTELTT